MKHLHRVVHLDTVSWNRYRLELILDQIVGSRILVVGDVGVDRYTVGSVDRISPEAPVPIVLVESERHKLGLAANVADNIKALGGDPLLVGVVGSDDNGKLFRKLLKQEKIVDRYLVSDSERRTVLKERIVSGQQQIVRIDYETPQSVSKRVRERIFKTVEKSIHTVDAVVLQDYAKGLIDHAFAQKLIALCKRKKKIIAIDPNLRTASEVYMGASVLTPNKKEAEILSGISISDEASVVEAGDRILKKTRADQLVIKLGKDGMALFQHNSKLVKKIPTFAREVFDVSGAGDTVISMLTMALIAGGTLEEASILGNLAAGVEVGKLGTATVSRAEVKRALLEKLGTNR